MTGSVPEGVDPLNRGGGGSLAVRRGSLKRFTPGRWAYPRCAPGCAEKRSFVVNIQMPETD